MNADTLIQYHSTQGDPSHRLVCGQYCSDFGMSPSPSGSARPTHRAVRPDVDPCHRVLPRTSSRRQHGLPRASSRRCCCSRRPSCRRSMLLGPRHVAGVLRGPCRPECAVRWTTTSQRIRPLWLNWSFGRCRDSFGHRTRRRTRHRLVLVVFLRGDTPPRDAMACTPRPVRTDRPPPDRGGPRHLPSPWPRPHRVGGGC